jgi:hypothetical protein
MKNILIDRKVRISADFDVGDWELYSNEEAEDIAEKLNKSLEFYVNNGYAKKEVYDNMMRIMYSHSKAGAADSEPLFFLERVLNEIYRTV